MRVLWGTTVNNALNNQHTMALYTCIIMASKSDQNPKSCTVEFHSSQIFQPCMTTKALVKNKKK